MEDEDLEDLLEPEELKEVERLASSMTAERLDEALCRLTRREVALLRDQRFARDPEMRDITLLNVATLVAAATLAEGEVIRGQKGRPGTGTDPDGPGSPPSPGSGPDPSG